LFSAYVRTMLFDLRAYVGTCFRSFSIRGLTRTQTLKADFFRASELPSFSKEGKVTLWSLADWLSGVVLRIYDFCFDLPRTSRRFVNSILCFEGNLLFFAPALLKEVVDFSICFPRVPDPIFVPAEKGDKLLIFCEASDAEATI
jgi:hypothetical protein